MCLNFVGKDIMFDLMEEKEGVWSIFRRFVMSLIKPFIDHQN